MTDAQFEYVTGQLRPTFPALLADYEAASQESAKRADARLDLAYGPHIRQKLDFFPASGTPRATLAYWHAGYWQSRDKATFRFIADTFNRAELHVALVNYPLCPEVSVMQIVAASAPALAQIGALGGGCPLIVSGHSAGAHIAVELGMREARAGRPIAGIVGLSGLYDLEPLVGTGLNAALGLDAQSALAASPVHRIVGGVAPGVFAVGGAETNAFIEQTRRMEALWSRAGNAASCQICAGDDHFTILRSFTEASHPLHRTVLELA